MDSIRAGRKPILSAEHGRHALEIMIRAAEAARWVGENFLDVGGLAAGLVISMTPIVVLYLLLSEQFMKGMSAGAVKG